MTDFYGIQPGSYLTPHILTVPLKTPHHLTVGLRQVRHLAPGLARADLRLRLLPEVGTSDAVQVVVQLPQGAVLRLQLLRQIVALHQQRRQEVGDALEPLAQCLAGSTTGSL